MNMQIEAAGPGSRYRPWTARSCIRLRPRAKAAIQVVGYAERCGSLDNVATVLAELSESLCGELLAEEARRAPLAWVQRLGYLLERVDQADLADYLDPVLTARTAFPVALAPWKKMNGSQRDRRWNVAENIEVVPDL